MANPIYQSVPEYVQQERLPLIAKAVIKAKSARLFNLQTGIKTSAALNLLNTAVQFGDGSTCGWDDAGSSTLSQRILKTGLIKINMSFCEKEMLKYWTQYGIRVSAGQKSLPFEEDFIGDVVKHIQANVEKGIWQGDLASEDENLNKFDGMLKILNAAVGTIKGTYTAGSIYAGVKAAVAALPAAVLEKDDVVVFVGTDAFHLYMQEMVDANFYHYNPENGGSEYILPGTSIRVIGVGGLNGTNAIVAGSQANFNYGTDLEDEQEKFDFWYSKDNREFRLAVEFNAGVQAAYPDQIALYTADGAGASVEPEEEPEAGE